MLSNGVCQLKLLHVIVVYLRCVSKYYSDNHSSIEQFVKKIILAPYMINVKLIYKSHTTNTLGLYRPVML